MLRLGITTLAVLVVVPACTGGPQSTPPTSSGLGETTTERSRSTSSATELLYVANDYANTVTIYNAEKKSSTPIGTISQGISGPIGLAVDGQQNLYVANSGGNSVTAYQRGQTTPFETLTDGIISPIDVAADNNGTLYVACPNSSDTAYVVQVFQPSSSTPSETLKSKAFKYISSVAVDSHDDLYVAAAPSGQGGAYEIVRFKAGSRQGQNMHLRLNKGHANHIVLGLAIDSSNRLVVSGIITNGKIFIYAFAVGSQNPSIKINPSTGGTRVAFSTDGNDLYVGDFASPGYASVPELKYPSGKLVYSFTSSYDMLAVAISPKAPF